ncbi:dynein light chain Tctex-type 5 isoform X2 [Drosophila willistoni]|uniref:dynein light chain Tctex-type 5 isoform X2 n=1 Tax=Drosophila willistoni TaxID=7260 RepID=UPI001F076AF3|nr:dynein light chain Tctex-type 5 isoform X2 [Drosophila willistoni]
MANRNALESQAQHIKMAAAKNWSGLVTLCLGQEREKKQSTSQRASLSKSTMGGVTSPLGLAAQQKATLRYMPTYRLEPKNPLKKERLEIIIKAVMNKSYNEEYMFHPKHSLHMAAQVSEEIKNRIKLQNFDRYRYIVIVSVGEYLMQGLYSMINFLWDAEKDGFVSYVVETPRYFAICTVFYIYYD